ncbi:MAG: nucleotidyl transferase AbiEii/AbiGii toxin family protein [Bacteroidetes bacterium]|nr:nucleotidyl transferase AbiEii/AbiGii toxin family protein [Bacteroidota bacterium]
MISQQTLTNEWISKVSVANNKADKILIEKVIRALLLLEGLVENGVPFVFKGGTALMLHFNSSKRLSIDIDIVMHEPVSLEPLFNKMAKEKHFIRAEMQERTVKYDIEKAHYKFFYAPVHQTLQGEEYVLLDILFEQPNYAQLISLPIDSAFVNQQGNPLKVNVPSLNDILGDKLTAFAPNTTGVPYEKGGISRAMEIIKQLYDVGNLFDFADDISIISSTFQKFAITEMGYRDLGKDWTIVLEDIYQTALLICTRGNDGKGDIDALQLGLRQIKGYIFSEGYNIENAITHASKAAYLSVLIKRNEKAIERFSNSEKLADWVIQQPFNTKLNKLKKTNPEAFFYWYKVYLLERP